MRFIILLLLIFISFFLNNCTSYYQNKEIKKNIENKRKEFNLKNNIENNLEVKENKADNIKKLEIKKDWGKNKNNNFIQKNNKDFKNELEFLKNSIIIILDPGHGGNDPGAINKIYNQYEKVFTLDIAKRIKKYLEKLKIKVILTRTKDIFIPLDKRVNIGNYYYKKYKEKSCFISIHLNSSKKEKAHGFEIWLNKNTKEKYAEKYKKSLKLAKWIEKYLKKLKLYNRGIKFGNFRVIKNTLLPSVLIEVCFISNKDNLFWILKSKNREKLAYQIYKAVLAYFISIFKKNNIIKEDK